MDASLRNAASNGDLDTLTSIVEKGANVNATDEVGFTALMKAAEHCKLDCLEYLIAKGAKLNVQNTRGKETALHKAAYEGHAPCVKSLVKAGANTSLKDVAVAKVALVRAQLAARGVTTVDDAAISNELQEQGGHVGRALNRLNNRQQAVEAPSRESSVKAIAKVLTLTVEEWLAAEEPLAKVGLRGVDLLEYQEGLQCKFWFVRADKLRAFKGTTPPKLQVLLRDNPDWLELRTVTFAEGITNMYAHSYLVVSHRWEEPGAPDEMGVQFAEAQAYLLANEAIDYWSMPQGEKAAWELIAFRVMLRNINLLYLFCGVLVLADLSYISRFWTQFEAFLSLRTVTKNGLEPAAEAERRCVIKCIHNAPSSFEGMIVEMWAGKTAREARDTLAKPDVTVTNQSDKEVQLPKLLKLNEFAQTHYKAAAEKEEGAEAKEILAAREEAARATWAEPGTHRPNLTRAATQGLKKWHFFLSHTQRNGDAKSLALELFFGFKDLDKKIWLDVKMPKMNMAAMKDGVNGAKCVIAIITGGDDKESRYFQRPMCVEELKWAIEAGVKIVPVVTAADKPKVGEYIAEGIAAGIDLSACDFQHIDRSNPIMMEASLKSIIGAEAIAVAGKAKLVGELANAGSSVQGLAELLASLKLAEHLAAADAWCVEQGAESVADLKEDTYAEDLAEALELKGVPAKKLVNAIRG